VLSEDKQWMAISAVAPDVDEETGKVKPSSERQVEIMNYNERFATAKKCRAKSRMTSAKSRQRPIHSPRDRYICPSATTGIH
jgi:hypothetical protein